MYQQGCRNMVVDLHQYPTNVENVRLARRSRLWAEAAWADVSHTKKNSDYSYDYARGFKDGFADYIQFGGSGEALPVPPRDYWRGRYQTPEGQQAMQDWFAGCRHGMAVAQGSGLREQVTVPLSLPLAHAPEFSSFLAEPKAAEPKVDVEVLPVPRSVKPDEKIPAPPGPAGKPKAEEHP
jgi:hypothetical protein